MNVGTKEKRQASGCAKRIEMIAGHESKVATH